MEPYDQYVKALQEEFLNEYGYNTRRVDIGDEPPCIQILDVQRPIATVALSVDRTEWVFGHAKEFATLPVTTSVELLARRVVEENGLV